MTYTVIICIYLDILGRVFITYSTWLQLTWKLIKSIHNNWCSPLYRRRRSMHGRAWVTSKLKMGYTLMDHNFEQDIPKNSVRENA